MVLWEIKLLLVRQSWLYIRVRVCMMRSVAKFGASRTLTSVRTLLYAVYIPSREYRFPNDLQKKCWLAERFRWPRWATSFEVMVELLSVRTCAFYWRLDLKKCFGSSNRLIESSRSGQSGSFSIATGSRFILDMLSFLISWTGYSLHRWCWNTTAPIVCGKFGGSTCVQGNCADRCEIRNSLTFNW
jgi:hypothetical protein